MKNKFKQSETIEIMRSEINFAPFNPKLHSPEAISEMVENFERVGFMGGIVWNEQTSNLVDGHKRIMSMDYLNGYSGTKKTDYPVKVEKVNLTLKEEKEQNLFFIFSATQKDDDLIRVLVPEIDYSNAGLSDQQAEYYGIILEDLNESPEHDFQPEKGIDLEEQPEAPGEPEKEPEKAPEKPIPDDDEDDIIDDDDVKPNKTFKEPDNLNSYVMLTFQNDANKKAFFARLGIKTNTTAILGEELSDRIEIIK